MWELENKLKTHLVHRSKRASSWRNIHLYICTSLRWHVFLSWASWLSVHSYCCWSRMPEVLCWHLHMLCPQSESFQTCFGMRHFCGLTKHCKQGKYDSLLLCMFFSLFFLSHSVRLFELFVLCLSLWSGFF